MQTIYLDISNKGVIPTIHAKQGDVGRKFTAVITDSGIPYKHNIGSSFSVWYESTNGEGNYSAIDGRSAFSIEGNKVIVEMIAQMTTNSGNGVMSLILNDSNGYQVGLWNIEYEIEAVPGMDSPFAEQYYTALSESAAKAIEGANRAEAAATKLVIDNTLSKKGQAADAAATGAALSGKLSEGLYSAEIISVNKDLSTPTFWEQVDSIYNSMTDKSVKLVPAFVTRPYLSAEYPHEPSGGTYRVTITRMAIDYGFVEAAVYWADSLGLPTLITRIKSSGSWRDPVKPIDAILSKITAASGISE